MIKIFKRGCGKQLLIRRKVSPLLIISENQIKELYTMKNAIQDLEQALHHYIDGKILNPHRTVLEFPEKHA